MPQRYRPFSTLGVVGATRFYVSVVNSTLTAVNPRGAAHMLWETNYLLGVIFEVVHKKRFMPRVFTARFFDSGTSPDSSGSLPAARTAVWLVDEFATHPGRNKRI